MEGLILEITTRGLHRYHAVDGDVITIGRALDNDVILSDQTVAPHHLKIIRYGDDSLELVNQSEVNPTRVDDQRIDSLVTGKLPLDLELGRVHLRLLPRAYAVAPTRALAGSGRRGHLFGHVSWAVLLVSLCLVVGALDFYLSAYNAFKWSELIKYVLRETVLTIGAFVIGLAFLERMLVNRWEIKQLIISISLLYLLFHLVALLADGLGYLFSASWPISLLQFGWFLVVIPCAIALYLVHISHVRRNRSILLAILIASPIAVPSLLQSPALQSMVEDFSAAARYQNSLSPLNWHLQQTVGIDRFIEQAQHLEAGQFAD